MNCKKLPSKTNSLFLVLLTFFISVFTISCNKNNEINSIQIPKEDPLVTASRSFFDSEVRSIKVEKSDTTISQTFSKSQRKKSMGVRLLKLNSELNWKESKVYNKGQDKYIIVPTNEALKPFTNKKYEFARLAIFYKSQHSAIEMSVIEILSKKDYSLGNVEEIANKAFQYKKFSENNHFGELNSYVMFYDKTYSPTGSFQINNGALTPARISFRCDLDIKAD